MNPFKIAAIFLVLISGLIGSYFIIKNSAPNFSLQSSQSNSGSTKEKIEENPIKWLENTAKSLTEPVKNLANLGSSLLGKDDDVRTESKYTINLTQFVAQIMFERMKGLDQAGEDPFESDDFDLNNPQSQELIQEMIASIYDSSVLFNPDIKNEDLKISPDNSREAKLSYLSSISEIGQKYFNDPLFNRSAEQIVSDINKDCFGGGGTINAKIAAAYDDMAVKHLKVSVPSDWTFFHKEIIGNLKKGNLIFEAIANCSMDPIKGYLAGEALPQFSSETLLIQKSLRKRGAEIGLLP